MKKNNVYIKYYLHVNLKIHNLLYKTFRMPESEFLFLSEYYKTLFGFNSQWVAMSKMRVMPSCMQSVFSKGNGRINYELILC